MIWNKQKHLQIIISFIHLLHRYWWRRSSSRGSSRWRDATIRRRRRRCIKNGRGRLSPRQIHIGRLNRPPWISVLRPNLCQQSQVKNFTVWTLCDTTSSLGLFVVSCVYGLDIYTHCHLRTKSRTKRRLVWPFLLKNSEVGIVDAYHQRCVIISSSYHHQEYPKSKMLLVSNCLPDNYQLDSPLCKLGIPRWTSTVDIVNKEQWTLYSTVLLQAIATINDWLLVWIYMTQYNKRDILSARFILR